MTHDVGGSRVERHIERLQAVTCASGKLQFKKRQDAQSHAAKINRNDVLVGPRIRAKAYRCWHCNQWHVGRPKFKLRGDA